MLLSHCVPPAIPVLLQLPTPYPRYLSWYSAPADVHCVPPVRRRPTGNHLRALV